MKSRSLKRSKLVVDAMPHIPDIIGGAAGVADHGGGPVSASVTGFGCRPGTDLTTRTEGPAFESRQGRKARGVGHLSQRAL